MKYRMTASAVIVSIVLSLIVLFAVGLFGVAQACCQAVQEKLYEMVESGSMGLTVKVGSIDGTLMKAIVARDVSIMIDGKSNSSDSGDGGVMASVEGIEVTSSIWKVLKYALGFGSLHVNVGIYNPTFSITDDTISFFERLAKSTSAVEGQLSDLGTATSHAKDSTLAGVSATINVHNASLDLELDALNANVVGVNASASFEEGFVLQGADLNVPSLLANTGSLGPAVVDDIRLSIDEDFGMTASIGGMSFERFGTTVQMVSAIAGLSNGKASVAFYAQSASASYTGYEISLLNPILNFELNPASLDDGASFVCSMPFASFKSDKDGLSVAMEETNFTGLASKRGLGIDSTSSKVLVLTRGITVSVNGLGLNVDSVLDFADITASKVLGSATALDVEVVGLPKQYANKVNASNMEIDASMLDGLAELRLKSHVNGENANEFIGDFSADLNASLSLTLSDTMVQNAGVDLSNVILASIPKKGDVSLKYRYGSGVNASMSVLGDLSGTVDVSFETNRVETRLYLEDVSPYEYEVVYKKLLSSQKFVLDDTRFDGSIVLSVGLPRNLDSVESVLKGEFGSLKDVADELEGSGRVSVNLAIHDLNVDGTPYSGALSFEASLDGTIIDVGTLAVTTGDYRISYAGSIDYNNLVPDGMLSFQNALDGSELARLEFDSMEGTKLYSFALSSPLSNDFSIHGTLDWQDASLITASAVLESGMLSAEELPFSVTVVKSPLEIKVVSESMNLDALVSSQSLLTVSGSMEGLSVKASDTLDVKVGMGVNIEYDLISGSIDAVFEDLGVDVSDLLGFGLSIHLSGNAIEAYDVSIERGGSRTLFNGGLYLSFDSIEDVLDLDPSKITASLDISDAASGTYAKGTVVDGSYYLDANINSFIDIAMTLLGSKDHGFHANGSVDWGEGNGFSFKSQYLDGRLGFYDSKGRIGNLELNEVGLSVDFKEMSMEFLLSFRNTVEKFAGENSVQRGTIALSGRLETLTSGFLSAVAGLDTDISFLLSFRDFSLEDGFGIPNTSVGILYSKGVVSLEGDLINGRIDTRDGYVDVHVDRSFLFGFDAKGFIGEELDIAVSNIYAPLPLVNQFADLLLMGFTNGEMTGDVLIKGPSNNPSLYGMLYCQLFEMWMVYLPGQSLVVNNIAITLQDHGITIPKTPYSGHSSIDGRFLSGTVAVEMDVQDLEFANMEVSLDVQSPIDLWVPLPLDSSDLEIRGDATGAVVFAVRNGSSYLECDVTAYDMLVDFRIENRPKWLDLMMEPINLDITLTTGKDVEFCYPEKNNAFIDFTLNEGETIKAVYEKDTKRIETSGSLSFKTGQVYYFQNDFYISEGSLDLTPRKFGTSINGISFLLNLSARLKDYDSAGNKVEVNLILQNATLDNITPRFTSTPSMSETEIIALLGQTILPSSTFDQQVSVASVASIAAAATEAFTRLGIIESNSSYSLASTIRESLGLDIFSLRSTMLQNIIIDALPGDVSGRSDISLLSKYLDGTSVFAGSYIMPGVFAQTSLRLKADRSGSRNSNVGHFLSKDLILDMEFSIDWDNPMGTFTIFTNPQELSPFSILDSIGFGVTKRIQF